MNLQKYRKEIDRIDKKIVELLNKRCLYAAKIGQAKIKAGQKIYVPEREKFIFNRISSLNNGPIPDKSLRAIYREIMSASFAVEKPLKIAILSSQNSESLLAAYSKFGHAPDYIEKETIPEVFNSVKSDKSDYCVVPLDSPPGYICVETLRLLAKSNLNICAEIKLQSAKSAKFKSAKFARFLVIGKQHTTKTGDDLTMIYFLSDKKNAHTKALKILKDEYLSPHLITTLAEANSNNVIHFVEFKGHIEEPCVLSTLEKIKQISSLCKVIGSYPQPAD